jgi:hypothetical protein
MKEQNEIYKTISDNNLRFIDSLANEDVFLGEKNLGLYTDKLIDSLHLSFRSIEDLLHQVLRYYHLPENTYVPVDREREYFEIDPVYNILFHNSGSYSALSKYKDKAITEGYLHPRAYESLKFNHHGFSEAEQLYLWPSNKEIKDTSYMNTKRRQSFLSTYETDLKKHQFAHLHNLKLYFGFRERKQIKAKNRSVEFYFSKLLVKTMQVSSMQASVCSQTHAAPKRPTT